MKKLTDSIKCNVTMYLQELKRGRIEKTKPFWAFLFRLLNSNHFNLQDHVFISKNYKTQK